MKDSIDLNNSSPFWGLNEKMNSSQFIFAKSIEFFSNNQTIYNKIQDEKEIFELLTDIIAVNFDPNLFFKGHNFSANEAYNEFNNSVLICMCFWQTRILANGT